MDRGGGEKVLERMGEGGGEGDEEEGGEWGTGGKGRQEKARKKMVTKGQGGRAQVSHNI